MSWNVVVLTPSTVEGVDASASVRVVADRRGGVLDVEVFPQWRDRLSASRFGDAVYEAYLQAVRTAALAATASLSSRTSGGHGTGAVGPSAAEDDRAWRAATWQALDEIGMELSRLRRIDLNDDKELDLPAERIAGPHGCLRAERRGRRIVGVTADSRRVARADVSRLTQDALVVLRAVPSTSDPQPGPDGV